MEELFCGNSKDINLWARHRICLRRLQVEAWDKLIKMILRLLPLVRNKRRSLRSGRIGKLKRFGEIINLLSI